MPILNETVYKMLLEFSQKCVLSPTDLFHQAMVKSFVHSKSRTAEAQFSFLSSAMLLSMSYVIFTYLFLDHLLNISQYLTHFVRLEITILVCWALNTNN